jgi:hypothetical protein
LDIEYTTISRQVNNQKPRQVSFDLTRFSSPPFYFYYESTRPRKFSVIVKQRLIIDRGDHQSAPAKWLKPAKPFPPSNPRTPTSAISAIYRYPGKGCRG